MEQIDKEITEHRKAMREFDFQIRSNRPLIYICTYEENRVLDAIRAICQRDDHNKWEVYVWDLASGLKLYTNNGTLPNDVDRLDQTMVLSWFDAQKSTNENEFKILVLKDYYKLMGSDGNAGQTEYQIIRELRNQSQSNISEHKCIVLMGANLFLPPELEKITSIIDWPLPERYHILEKINEVLKWAKTYDKIKNNFVIEYDDKELGDIVNAFQGLTLIEIELLCSYMILTTNKFDPSLIANKKRDIIRKSGLLDWIEPEESIDSVGGLYGLKDWLMKRKDAFSQEAQEYGLPKNPKGILLIGIQGAGKSVMCKAISKFWNLPLLKLDMGKIFSGIVGSSEENIRNAIKIAESIAPTLVWTDEIDKGMAGSASSNNTDGGTAARVFGSLISWMQEKDKPVYIVATANDVSQLPPELLRKGRFDEIFFVDLPSEEERKEIIKIHLSKRKRNFNDFDINQISKESDGFTGAEIESCIISAMYESFNDGKREPTSNDIINSIRETIPLSITMSEHIEGLRNWAKNRARNASNKEKIDYNDHGEFHVERNINPDEEL